MSTVVMVNANQVCVVCLHQQQDQGERSASPHSLFVCVSLRRNLLIIRTSGSSPSSRSFFPPPVSLQAQQVCFPLQTEFKWARRFESTLWSQRSLKWTLSSLWLGSSGAPGALLSPHTGFQQLCSTPCLFLLFKIHSSIQIKWNMLSGLKTEKKMSGKSLTADLSV